MQPVVTNVWLLITNRLYTSRFDDCRDGRNAAPLGLLFCTVVGADQRGRKTERGGCYNTQPAQLAAEFLDSEEEGEINTALMDLPASSGYSHLLVMMAPSDIDGLHKLFNHSADVRAAPAESVHE
jgi:hypothetical protein